ncbi:MAG TPA: ABC transporter permease [Methylomirabilota bacterium]|jgi:putative ABC transport system permease protein
MRLGDHWRQVGISLSRHRLRTGLTALGVFWGVFMLVLLQGVGKGLERGVFEIFRDDAFNSVWVHGGHTTVPYQGLVSGRAIRLSIEDVAAVGQALADIGDLSPRQRSDRPVAFGRLSQSFEILGIHPGYHVVERTIVLRGRLVSWRDVQENRRIAVIGSRVVELLFRDRDPVGERIEIGGAGYLVVGTFTDTGGENELRRIYIPYPAYQRSFGADRRLDSITFTIPESTDPLALEARVRAVLSTRHRFEASDRAAITVWNNLEEYKKFRALFTGISVFVTLVGVATLFAGLVGVGNIMLIAVRERTREIGLRKAVGATSRTILVMILSEALVITTVSGYVGLVLGVGAIDLLRRSGLRAEYFRDPEVDLAGAGLALGVLIAGGVIAGLIPARQAARVDPAEALRHE